MKAVNSEALPIVETLPPRWRIDHEIKLILGTKPPTKNDYRMASPEILKKDCTIDWLLKKGTIWRWPVECQTAFDDLKVTMTSDLVLGLVDVSKLFIVEIDVLDFTLGGVLTQEGHDPGWQRTYALLKKGYFWPSMQDDESVSMDFITHLPKVGDLKVILVIIDRFSKYATFIHTTKLCSIELTTQLFFKHVLKLWEVPTSIVSDCYGRKESANSQLYERIEVDYRYRLSLLRESLEADEEVG
ncbi:reverse transcriptase [Cucumis melo var. makuwa]|uniref:Reverse transcriptase n=1 Tax=Cucumis melo var. makuwa TaxID=1194695 RepID=A0A5D3DUT3_CUCMM|nr:reverse transcriptase [Cucumis melo var. makuwa]TYK27443.1 reverse transcriptase [Cucumis melo var. makuwa]